jgi:hypothetical protein
MTKTPIKRQAKTHYLNEFPNLFKPIQKGARAKAVEYIYKYQNGAILDIRMWWQLDIADQDLFLTIISLIAEYNRGKTGEKDSNNIMTQNLREKLELKNLLFDLPILKMKTTTYKLLETIGKTYNKQTYQWVLDSLKRLSLCGISYNTNKYIGSSNLLSYSIDKDTKEIHIAINPVSASVFLSDDRYVIHNLQERFLLKMEAAKALQSYLNRVINVGEKRTLYLETIIEGIYGDAINDLKNRRRTIKKAIEELVQYKEYKYIIGLNDSYVFKRNSNFLFDNFVENI